MQEGDNTTWHRAVTHQNLADWKHGLLLEEGGTFPEGVILVRKEREKEKEEKVSNLRSEVILVTRCAY